MKSRYMALQQKRADLLKIAGIADDPAATPEQLAEAKAALTEISAIDTELADLEKLRDAQRRAPAAAGAQGITVRDRAEDDPTRGFHSLVDFAASVRAATIGNGLDPRLTRQRVGIGAAPSGYLETQGSVGEAFDIPPEYRQEIFELMFAGPSLLSMVTVEPTNSNMVKLIKDESTPWGASGVQAAWRAEGVQLSASKLATSGANVELHELAAFVLATEELLEDAPRMNSRLTRSAGAALAHKAGEAIMNGTGAGQPLGWMNAACLVSVAKEGGQAADTIVAANVAKLYSRNIRPGSALWLTNQDTLPQYLTMTLANQPIWTPPASGFANAPGGFLFGRPIMFTEHNATLGDQGDIQFVDLAGYFATQKNGGIKFASSIHLFFDYNIQAFRWITRMGGQPFLSAAVSPAKGSATKSHFVTLDARA